MANKKPNKEQEDNQLISKIEKNDGSFYIHTLGNIDKLFSELQKGKRRVKESLDWAIRAAIKEPKLLRYYVRKLKNYRSNRTKEAKGAVEVSTGPRKRKLGKLKNKILKFSQEQQSSFEALREVEWILDWNCVMFKSGYIVIYSRSELNVKFKPAKIYMPQSMESFNYLRKYLKDRLEPIRCLIKNDTLTVLDKINLNKAIQQFEVATHQGLCKVPRTTGIRSALQQMSFAQALSKAKQMTPEEFRKYKSAYIDYLVDRQCKDYKVIPCVERLSYSNSDITEYAFMFTIESRYNTLLIVHENVNPDRSALLFVVRKDTYSKSIREIYNFLQSAEINKRSSLRDRDIDISELGVLRYRSINHDELWSWKSTIMTFM